jgi:hypothetical protein
MHIVLEQNFKPMQWLKLIEQAQDLMRDQNSAIIFYADSGCGKSVFVKIFKQHMPDHYLVCDIAACSTLKLKTLTNTLATELHGEFQDLAKCIDWVNQQRKHCILIIDDADTLSEDTITELYKIFAAKNKQNTYFNLIFCSSKPLSLPNLPSFNLGYLSETETKTYIDLKLKKNNCVIYNKEISKIFSETKGSIAQINKQLATFSASTLQRKSGKMLTKILAALTLAITTAILGYGRFIWQQEALTASANSINTPALFAILPYYITLVKNTVKPKVQPIMQPVVEPVVEPVVKKSPVVLESKPQAVAKNYTIQLIASRVLEDVKQFIVVNHLEKQAQIKILVKNGVKHYVAVIGSYESRAAAAASMKNLDDEIRLHKPWPRALKDLQALS